MNARVLKFHIHIPHVKIVDTYFFSCPSYAPFLSYVPLKTKFENIVCKISIFMPPTLKKLEGHIAFGLSVCVWVGGCVC